MRLAPAAILRVWQCQLDTAQEANKAIRLKESPGVCLHFCHCTIQAQGREDRSVVGSVGWDVTGGMEQYHLHQQQSSSTCIHGQHNSKQNHDG